MQQQKKKAGRPSIIKDSVDLGVRIDRGILAKLDEMATERRVTRSELVREILAQGAK